jgi:hypothetical protein
MIIMQTSDAVGRREYIQKKGLGKVIFTHETGDSVCVQYHPKGIRGTSPNRICGGMQPIEIELGGVIPELDSHTRSASNPDPLIARFSPWHACGSIDTYPTYSKKMRRNGDLHLLGATLRLKPGETDTQAAAKQWEETFGIKRNGDTIEFTQARLGFVKGEEGKSEGITEIRIGVEGQKRMEEILWRAKFEGLSVDKDGLVEMLGVRWKFVLAGGEKSKI